MDLSIPPDDAMPSEWLPVELKMHHSQRGQLQRSHLSNQTTVHPFSATLNPWWCLLHLLEHKQHQEPAKHQLCGIKTQGSKQRIFPSSMNFHSSIKCISPTQGDPKRSQFLFCFNARYFKAQVYETLTRLNLPGSCRDEPPLRV